MKSVLLAASCVFIFVSSARADLKLWYAKPASAWMTEALPIGNGRIGGMVFGTIGQEHIQFNESHLWSGGPGEWSDYANGNLPGGADHVKQLQDFLRAGNVAGATPLVKQYFVGNKKAYGAYQPFGDLLIDCHAAAPKEFPQDYFRELDLDAGVARVHYTLDGVTYEREYFCSYPDQVMVMRFTASKPGSINLTLHITSGQAGASVAATNNTVTLSGKLPGNSMGYQGVAIMRSEGAQPHNAGNAVQVEKADAVMILLTAATDYLPKFPTYKGNDYQAANDNALQSTGSKSYKDLLDAHEKDYQALFGRVALNLPVGTGADLPTDQRLAANQKSPDPALAELFYQFGRYLLISSSRPGGLPSNMQGLWNDNGNAPWGSDFHTAMNVQMMYWPAETGNLSECAEPLIDFINGLREPGRATAKTYYGAGGWVTHFASNVWGYTAPGTGTYENLPASAAWLCQHVWDHYTFTGSKRYLRDVGYPIMKEAAQFWVDHLCEDADGTLVASPSVSPEIGPVSAGCSMDQEIIWDLFTNCIEASKVLDTDAEFRAQLTQMREKLSPLKIGKWGQLQEWKADVDDPKETHRHVSHLFALHPGHEISPITTPELAAAARKSLEARGDGGPGWGIGWKVDFWARLLDGDHAYTVLQSLLLPTVATRSSSNAGMGTYPNMFDAHPPLQVDGDLAGAAGIAEMLLQSQNDEIHLLPALPKAWSSGNVRGLRARGGFEVDETWKDGALTAAKIQAGSDGVCRIRSAVPITIGGVSDARHPQDNVTEFEAKAGQTYVIGVASH
jgi:alpha-L-fucosidase 2